MNNEIKYSQIGDTIDRREYSYNYCMSIVLNDDKQYYIYNIHFYNKEGIILSIPSSKFIRQVPYLKYEGETKRKLKLKLDGTNFIIKNDWSWESRYDLYIYCSPDGNYLTFKRKQIQNNQLEYVYCLNDEYEYRKPVKDFNPLIRKYVIKIENEVKSIKKDYRMLCHKLEKEIDLPYIMDEDLLELLLLDKCMYPQDFGKRMTRINRWIERIKSIKCRMSSSYTFNRYVGELLC